MKVILQKIPYIDAERIYANLYKPFAYSFWLDGNLLVEGLSRYSFLGGNPSFLIKIDNGITEVIDSSEKRVYETNPFNVIQKYLDGILSVLIITARRSLRIIQLE